MKRLLLPLFACLVLLVAKPGAQSTAITHGSTLPSRCVVGNVYQKTGTSAGIYYCSSTNTWTLSSSSGGGGVSEFPVTTYGAKCDNSTDDSTALQAALTAAAAAGGGTVVLPVGHCKFNTPLVAGGNMGGSYDHINVRGDGPDESFLTYGGTNTSDAITLSHVGYFEWSGFSLSGNSAGVVGGGDGLLLTGPFGSGGTQTLAGLFERVSISGFRHGMVAGGGDAASEISCVKCAFNNNDVGWTASGFNSLNFAFFGLSLQGNVRGVELGGDGTYAGQVTERVVVFGCDTANNTDADFFFGNNFGETILDGCRAEPKNYFARGVSVSRPIIVRGLSATATTRGDHVIIHVNGPLTVQYSDLIGLIEWGGDPNSEGLRIEGTEVGEGDAGLPFKYITSGQHGGVVSLVANLKNGGATGSANQVFGPFKDLNGIYQQVTGGTAVLYPNADATLPTDNTLNGGLHLDRVRSLAHGTATPGENLGGVVTFATSGSAAFTFTRTLSVTTVSGSPTISFASGAINKYDVGKSISIAAATNICSIGPTGPVTGTIVSITDATHAVVHSTQRSNAQSPTDCEPLISVSGSETATIGTNEPDANWWPVGLACTAAEDFYFDPATLSSSGVTFKSSNASSTATCTFLMRR
jgi:hypothetical protein